MPTEEEIAAAQKLVEEEKAKKEAAAKAAGISADTETPEQTIARVTKERDDARNEAGKQRINAKENAAKDAEKETLKKVAIALGIIPEENADPVKLFAQVQEAQGKAKSAEVRLAVFSVADAANANAKALLDSNSFLAKVASIDPSDEVALTALITSAVEENPLLAKTPGERPAPRPDYSQASGANNRPAAANDADKFAAWWKATSQ